MIELELPWPPKELSPNARVHWKQRHRHSKAYREACAFIALAEKGKLPAGRLDFWVIFCPPSRRHHDDDNLLARFKAGRDGIADGLGINDRLFSTTIIVGEPVKGGAVRVRIRPAATENYRGESA